MMITSISLPICDDSIYRKRASRIYTSIVYTYRCYYKKAGRPQVPRLYHFHTIVYFLLGYTPSKVLDVVVKASHPDSVTYTQSSILTPIVSGM